MSSHRFHGSFSYNNDHISVIQIEDNINIRVERENVDVAIIYFVNDQGGRIRIPPGITVRNVTNNTIIRPSRHGRWFYSISWVSSYAIHRDNEHIISINNQKQQAISGNDNFFYYTTDSENSKSDDDDDEDGGSNNDDDEEDGGSENDEDDGDSAWGELIQK
ncbi:unnamed protein product [Rhizophagus irregularis]|uniref:Uncharacterized protein n=1 Tax=Rhizophagus irregularis TaxID=588596 RepID=A0A2I1HBE5_9GLOM|nr:hypothetical protein RhiirA4_476298 [Rhizophagus irregularis]CAB4435767.1 unnamed protein product [Rhizophagus irregularis]